MECHDCRRELYWKEKSTDEATANTPMFSPHIDKFIRCFKCWKLRMDVDEPRMEMTEEVTG